VLLEGVVLAFAVGLVTSCMKRPRERLGARSIHDVRGEFVCEKVALARCAPSGEHQVGMSRAKG